jgi:hypothetical protein
MAATASAGAGQSIEHCCGLLQRGKSDEERFVGLLLASKLVAEPADLRRVCDAALPFVLRLVNSPPPPDTVGSGNPYRGLALSVLAGFVTDAKLLSRSDLLRCAVAAGASALGAGASASAEEARDAATVLDAALRQPAGLAEAVRTRILSTVLARACALPAEPPPPPADPEHAPADPALACSLLTAASDLICASAGTPMGDAIFSLTHPHAARSELLAATSQLALALGASRDTATAARLDALLALLSAAEVCSSRTDELPPLPATDPLSKALRLGLGSLLSSKVQPAIRAAVLRAARAALGLLGPLWVVGPSPLRRPSGPPSRAATGESVELTAEARRIAELPTGHGALLSLLIQLSTVEWCMCLHDQPADAVSPHVAVLLPACCGVLEEALFRLHADAGEEGEEEAGPHAGGVSPTCWLDALTDEELLSAQWAFQSVAKAGVEYIEAVRAEAAAAAHDRPAAADAPPGSAAPPHPLLLPVCRLLTAWLVQPSAFASMQLYDRANAVLPTLQHAAASAEGQPDAWVRELRRFERVPPSAAGAAAHLPPGTTPPSDETMADMFAKVMGGASGPEADALLRELRKQR